MHDISGGGIASTLIWECDHMDVYRYLWIYVGSYGMIRRTDNSQPAIRINESESLVQTISPNHSCTPNNQNRIKMT